jgi:hypothetical protein
MEKTISDHYPVEAIGVDHVIPSTLTFPTAATEEPEAKAISQFSVRLEKGGVVKSELDHVKVESQKQFITFTNLKFPGS